MSKLVKASIWLSLSELAFNLSGYIIHAVLGRVLEPAEYGRYSLIVTFATMVIVLIGTGIPTAMSKYLSEIFDTKPELIPVIKRTGAKLQLSLIIVVTILYFSLSSTFAKLLGDDSLTTLFRISSLIVPAFALASFYFYYYTGIHQFGKQAFLKFTRSIAKVVFIIGLGYYFNAAGAIIGQAIAPFTVFIDAYFLDPYRKNKKNFKQKITTADYNDFHWKKLLQFAWPITLFMVFYELMITADLYLVKGLLNSDEQTGIYNATLTVGRIPYYAFYFLTIILLPKISQTTSRGLMEETKKTLQSSMRFLFMFLFPIVTILSLFSDSAIRFFYGAKYSPAGEPMSILVFGVGFLTVFYILSFVLNGAGKNTIPMWTALAGTIVNFILNYIFIKKYGLNGSAIATSITSLFAMIISFYYVQKRIAPVISAAAVSKYLIASFAIYLIGYQFFSQGRFIFFIWSAILMGIYIGLLFLMGEIKASDRKILFSMLKKSPKRELE